MGELDHEVAAICRADAVDLEAAMAAGGYASPSCRIPRVTSRKRCRDTSRRGSGGAIATEAGSYPPAFSLSLHAITLLPSSWPNLRRREKIAGRRRFGVAAAQKSQDDRRPTSDPSRNTRCSMKAPCRDAL
jgi:hypothetical protein